LEPEVAARFARNSVTDVSDKVGRLYTMDAGMRPLYSPMMRIVGSALTVKLAPGDNWALHGALQLAGAGHVLVVDWQGYTDGCGAGVLSLIAAIRRGLAGIVVDGAWRDVKDLEVLGFPVVGRGVAPFSPAKREFGEINVPVSCGGVIVEPGDVVVADAEGCAVVPREHAALVAGALPEVPAARDLETYAADAETAKVAAMGTTYQRAHAAMLAARRGA
jgi:regulator of RNase E activity RraA